MEHRLISGGEQWLPFARSCIAKLKRLGLPYAAQSFEIDGASIRVRIEPGHEYIKIDGGGAFGWYMVPRDEAAPYGYVRNPEDGEQVPFTPETLGDPPEDEDTSKTRNPAVMLRASDASVQEETLAVSGPAFWTDHKQQRVLFADGGYTLAYGQRRVRIQLGEDSPRMTAQAAAVVRHPGYPPSVPPKRWIVFVAGKEFYAITLSKVRSAQDGSTLLEPVWLGTAPVQLDWKFSPNGMNGIALESEALHGERLPYSKFQEYTDEHSNAWKGVQVIHRVAITPVGDGTEDVPFSLSFSVDERDNAILKAVPVSTFEVKTMEREFAVLGIELKDVSYDNAYHQRMPDDTPDTTVTLPWNGVKYSSYPSFVWPGQKMNAGSVELDTKVAEWSAQPGGFATAWAALHSIVLSAVPNVTLSEVLSGGTYPDILSDYYPVLSGLYSYDLPPRTLPLSPPQAFSAFTSVEGLQYGVRDTYISARTDYIYTNHVTLLWEATTTVHYAGRRIVAVDFKADGGETFLELVGNPDKKVTVVKRTRTADITQRDDTMLIDWTVEGENGYTLELDGRAVAEHIAVPVSSAEANLYTPDAGPEYVRVTAPNPTVTEDSFEVFGHDIRFGHVLVRKTRVHWVGERHPENQVEGSTGDPRRDRLTHSDSLVLVSQAGDALLAMTEPATWTLTPIIEKNVLAHDSPFMAFLGLGDTTYTRFRAAQPVAISGVLFTTEDIPATSSVKEEHPDQGVLIPGYAKFQTLLPADRRNDPNPPGLLLAKGTAAWYTRSKAFEAIDNYRESTTSPGTNVNYFSGMDEGALPRYVTELLSLSPKKWLVLRNGLETGDETPPGRGWVKARDSVEELPPKLPYLDQKTAAFGGAGYVA